MKPTDEEKPLDDEQLEGAAGGYIFYNAGAPDDSDWEVLDDKGAVVARLGSMGLATIYAREHGYGEDELSWPMLKRLRETGSII